MKKLRNLLALLTAVLLLASLSAPAMARAAMDHAAGGHGAAHAQVVHLAQPDGRCCATAGDDAAREAGALCASCVATCFGMQATLEAVASSVFAHSSTGHLAHADQALRSAVPEAALRPPKIRS